MEQFDSLHEDPLKSPRYSALCALLTLPDPADLPPRTHRYCYAGDPTRQERLKQELAAAYGAHCLQPEMAHRWLYPNLSQREPIPGERDARESGTESPVPLADTAK